MNEPSEMPTPRTDAEKTRSWEERRKEHYTSEARAGHSNDGWKFAEQLERDLSTLRIAAEAARVALDRLHDAVWSVQDWNGTAVGDASEVAEAALALLRSELAKTTPATPETPAPHPG